MEILPPTARYKCYSGREHANILIGAKRREWNGMDGTGGCWDDYC